MTKNRQTKVLTKYPEETKKFAESLGKDAKKTGGIFALIGDLGTGKTTFTQGFAKGLGINQRVISPTFVLIKQHQIPKTTKIFYHIDLYRLKGEIDLLNTGLKEIIDSENIIVIEWADKIKNKLPQNITTVIISKETEDSRIIVVT